MVEVKFEIHFKNYFFCLKELCREMGRDKDLPSTRSLPLDVHIVRAGLIQDWAPGASSESLTQCRAQGLGSSAAAFAGH